MDPEAGRTMEVAALGRPFSLGMLYDCRQDLLIPGLTLWDRSDLEQDARERPKPNSHFEIVASESIEDKSSALNVEASLKASFLGGLVQVEGSAKYLNDQKTSRKQARVTLTYKTTTKFQELSMDHLGRGNIKHQYVFDKGIATHVVTGILYGAQAFFIFDREVSEKEDIQDIQGSLRVMIKKIPCFSVEGKGSVKMEDKDKANVERFSCKFHGDFTLKKNPVSYQDAVEVYQSLPELLGDNAENAVPMKVWLLPLASLDSSAAKLVREISIRLVQEAQNVLEDFSDLEIRCNDALRTTMAQQFPQICKKLKTFKEMCSEFKLEFQRNLAKKLPSIRGGGEEETELIEILKRRHSSPFNSKSLNEWMDCKERELSILKIFTKMLKNTQIIPSLNQLYEESVSAEHVVCFVFTSLGNAEPYLSALSNYLNGTTKPEDPQNPHYHDVEREQWYIFSRVADEMRTKAKLFSDFAEANKESKNIKFLTLGITNETQKGSSIYLYKDAFPVSENFEPPSKPESVTSDINHNNVTLKISPPRFGTENIIAYSVEYCVSGEDEWQKKTTPKSDDEVTVSDLKPNTVYEIRSRAVTTVGLGPASSVNDSIKTLPCSPPGEPQVESNSREISVRWERPAELGQDVQILSYIVEYAKVESLEWNQIMARGEKVVIDSLQSETQYCVRVTCDCGKAGRSKESVTVNVSTTKRAFLAEFLKQISTTNSNSVYNLPLEEEDIDIDGCQKYVFGKENIRQNRTIMFVGVTGAGKTTLINGMINYIVGVKWEDNFRFKLIDEDQSTSQAHCQTSKVTVYKINHQDGFTIPFSLTVVDTPEFGHQRGVARDKEITEQIRRLFTSANGVSEIDAVCLVAQASLGRLTATQKDRFDSVLSVFAKDVAENIRVLVTFADGQQPPVLEAINASGVPCPKTDKGLPVHFKFSNSAVFAKNYDSDDGGFDKMFWDMGTKSMKGFFAALNTIETKSLTMTKQVFKEREQPLAYAVKKKSTELKSQTGSLHVYAVPLKEEEINVLGCRRFIFGKESQKKNRTIMVLGATGAGKSTLLNGMINYILGVEWEDEFRFKLVDEGDTVSQDHSQMSVVTVYKLNHQDGFNCPFSLTIVDTPGFGYTRGIDRDREITEQLCRLFSAHQLGVSEIDAVCFVVQAALARLTSTQKYVFDSVLSIFGKDVAENIRVLVTFADGQQPPVLEAINASGVPCPKTDKGLPVHFKFNNSALFAKNANDDDDDDNGGFDKMFWDMGTKSMKRFFAALNTIETKSLTMTKQVFKELEQPLAYMNTIKTKSLATKQLDDLESRANELMKRSRDFERTAKSIGKKKSSKCLNRLKEI